MKSSEKYRCQWSQHHPLMMEYHDHEWGVPVHDDKVLFEFLILEGAQAGLSWQTVLNKREAYRKAFDDFDVKKIARYGELERTRLLADAGIIRNRLKIGAAVANAKAFLKVQKEFGSFDNYIWNFVHGHSIDHKIKIIQEVPCVSEESKVMSKDLLKRDFKFVGPTICYAFMQAVGMVNDHEIKCFRHCELL
ncbi:MAG: DNA-3-methyladenine glycosylase I [Chthoniobacterales bacterium]